MAYAGLLADYLSGLPLVDEDAEKIAAKLSVSVRTVREYLRTLRSEYRANLPSVPDSP